jgi:hypothetical protein
VLKGNFASSVFNIYNAKTQMTQICVTGPQCVNICSIKFGFGVTSNDASLRFKPGILQRLEGVAYVKFVGGVLRLLFRYGDGMQFSGLQFPAQINVTSVYVLDFVMASSRLLKFTTTTCIRVTANRQWDRSIILCLCGSPAWRLGGGCA